MKARPSGPTPSIVLAMQPELDRVNRWRSEPLGITLETRFARNRDGVESAVGNLFADAMRAAVPDADLAIGMGCPARRLRAGLPPGVSPADPSTTCPLRQPHRDAGPDRGAGAAGPGTPTDPRLGRNPERVGRPRSGGVPRASAGARHPLAFRRACRPDRDAHRGND